MATEEQQVLEALGALSSIPDEFHWFCDLTEESEHSSQESACSLDTSQRIEKAQVLLKLFAIDHGTLPWVKDQLIKQLSRCAEEYDMAEIEGFFEQLNQWDVERIAPILQQCEQTIQTLPPQDRRLNNIDKEALYAMFDVLCDPTLLQYEPLASHFRFAFSAIQQRKSKLKVDHDLPAMIVFLFDKDQGLKEWATYTCTRRLSRIEPTVFEKELLPFLTKTIRRAAEFGNEEDLTRFFSGALTIIQNASRELILKCICGANEDLIKFTINHVADKAKYLENILLLIGELMRKLRYDFWDAASPVSPTTFVDWVFSNPQIEGTFLQDRNTGDDYGATLQSYTNWIVPFAETMRPSNRAQASSNLLFNLLNKYQNQKSQPIATSICLREGMKILRMSLDELSKRGISGSVEHILCRTAVKLVQQHMGPLRKVLSKTSSLFKDVSENLAAARAEARTILQYTLVLNCRIIYEDYRLLSKDKSLPSETITSYFQELYYTVLDQFVVNDTELACDILGSLLDLVGLEKIRIQDQNPELKVSDSPLRTAKLEFNKTLGLLNATVGEILNRVSEFDPEHLVQILQHPKASRFVIASLFSPENGYYLPGVDIIKQAFNTIGKVEGLTVMLTNNFDTAINAFIWGIRRITQMRTFGPMPSLVKTCVYLIQILCDSPDGLFLQEGRFTTEDEKNKLSEFWEYQWRLLGAIFEETINFQKAQDRGTLVEFTRDTMEYADTLFSSFPAFEKAIAPLVPESAFEANSQQISKTGIDLLQFANRSIYKIAMWLRLRDEPLLRICHGLLCKILKQLHQANITVESSGISRLMKFATRGDQSKYQTNMTEQQKADLRAACGEPVVSEKHISRKSDTKKQTTLAQWTAPIDDTRIKREADKEVIEIPDEDSDDGFADEDLVAALERSERTAISDKLKQQSKALPPTPKARPSIVPRGVSKTKLKVDPAVERARADVAERVRLRKEMEREKELAMQSTVGATLQGINIKPANTPKKGPIVIGDETSSSEEEGDDEDDGTGLFALATKSKKTTQLIDGPRPGFRQPVNFTVQKQARSAADLRARLTPDLSPLYRRILNWDFFHDQDFPPGSIAKDYMMVTNIFQNVAEYKSTFEPLLMLECWNQFRKAKEENNFAVFSLELATRMNADNFVELHMTMDQTDYVAQKVSVMESDVLLVSTAANNPLSSPSEPSCLARVVGITKKRSVVEISLRCLPSPSMLPALKVKAKYRVAKILSLTPLEREYGALLSLAYYDLLDEILHARPSPLVKPPDDEVERTRSNYQVNEPQARAICAATNNEGFTLIQGPPGTGKTKTVVGIVGSILTPGGDKLGAAPTKGTKKILVCAPSNAAVDELVLRFKDGVRTLTGENFRPNIVRLGRSDAINAAVKDVTLDDLIDARLSGQEALKRATGGTTVDAAQLREEMNKLLAERDAVRAAKDNAFANNHEDRLKLQQEERELTNKIRTKGRQIDEKQDAQSTDRRNQDILRRKIQQEIMDQAQIICATLSGAGHEMLKSVNVEFDTVVIDEAAQSIELSALIPLKYGCTKCILVGDPKQLSLFVRMQMNHPDNVHLLSIQYRMHPDISRFPSTQFYDSELQDGPDMAKLRQRLWHQSNLFGPYRFFDIQGQESSASGHSLVNHQEVTTALSLFRRITTDFRDQDFSGMIGIITPYKQQLFELKRRFKSEYGQKIVDAIEFNTTDAFQGREREVIIFSCVRASPFGGVGFLSDIRRMNVGLTRAKSSLFILGNAQSLLRNEFWGKLVRDAKARGVYTDGSIQGMLSKSTRIFDPSAREVIFPMAMDIDVEEPQPVIKKDSIDQHTPTADPRIKQDFNQKVSTQPPRKRPGTVDPRPNSRKQQAAGQGNIPNRQPVIPLSRPMPTPIVAPASLIPPTPSYDLSEPGNVGQPNGPLCRRCGNFGHVRAHCANPENAAKVRHMLKHETGDPHDRSIPPVQSSLAVEEPRAQKRKPKDHSNNSAKRREIDGRVPAPQDSNVQPGNVGGNVTKIPPRQPQLMARIPTNSRPVAPPRPKKAADPFIRPKDKKRQPRPPNAPGA
ncbi:SEN1 N terminal-domain-containing protein [Tirmania nivea]|nr:SEN1 N terminal-domain-containing protein [Tirmania nivea]